MYRITDAYESGNSSNNLRLFMGVVGSLLFTVVLVLFLTINSAHMNKKLASTASDLETLQNKKDADYQSLRVSGNSELEGDINAGSNLTVAGSGNFDEDLTVGGELQVTGKANIQTALSVQGDTTFNDSASILGVVKLDGTLDVTGATILQSGLAVGGDTSIASTLTVTGSSVLGGSLDIGDAALLRGPLSIGGDTTAGGGLTVSGTTSVGGSFDIAGAALLQNSLSIGGDATVDASGVGARVGFTVNGTTSLGGDLGVTGIALLNGNLSAGTTDNSATFEGTGSSNGLVSSLSGSAPSFSVQGTTSLGGDLGVTGIALLNGNLSAGTTDNSATFEGTAINAGTTTLLGPGTPTFTVQQDTSLGGDLGVTGVALLNGNLNATSAEATATFDGTAINGGGGVQLLTTSTQTFKVDKDTTFAGSEFDVMGTTLLNGNLTLSSSDATATFTGIDSAATAFTVIGSVIFSGSEFDVSSGAVVLNNGLTLTNTDGTLTAGSMTVQGTTQINGDINLDTGEYRGDALNVEGNATVQGNLTVGHTVVNGVVTAAGGLIFASDHLSAPYYAISDGVTKLASGENINTVCGGDGRAITNFSSRGGLVVGIGDCITVTDHRYLNSSGNGSGACKSGDEHIRITEVTNGLISGSECAANTTNNFDVAERYRSTDQLAAGEVVSIDKDNPEYVLRSQTVHDDTAIGVISTAPGLVLGSSTAGYPVALSGRVPVKFTSENGQVTAGDYLTSASMPGYAKKAAPGEKTIGQALEGSNASTGTVMMFVSISPAATQAQAIVQGAGSVTQGGVASVAGLNVSGPSTLHDLTVIGSATIANLTVTGQATVLDITINGHIIGNADTRGTVKIVQGQTVIHHDFTTPYAKAPAVVASPTNQATLFTVNASPSGFDITLPTPASIDTAFNYLVQE